jgi:hypothetical protein
MVHQLILVVISGFVGGLEVGLEGLREIMQLDGFSYCCHNMQFKHMAFTVGLVRIDEFSRRQLIHKWGWDQF